MLCFDLVFQLELYVSVDSGDWLPYNHSNRDESEYSLSLLNQNHNSMKRDRADTFGMFDIIFV